MIRKYFMKDLIITIILTIIINAFILIVFLTNYNKLVNTDTINSFNDLSIYFKCLFYFTIILFNDYEYLYIYTAIYVNLLIIIYYIVLLTKYRYKNNIEAYTALTKHQNILYYIISKALNILIILITVNINYLILNLSLYNTFSNIYLYGLSFSIIIIVIISIIYYYLKYYNLDKKR